MTGELRRIEDEFFEAKPKKKILADGASVHGLLPLRAEVPDEIRANPHVRWWGRGTGSNPIGVKLDRCRALPL